jgi:uncharacterized membrane protein
MKTANRLLYLDWMRGLAAVIMLQGHVFHSFVRNDLRTGGPYVFSQFVGGMPPAIFLFLTGVTLAFLMDSQTRKGYPFAKRWMGALRRAGYLIAVAFAFRIQLWLFTRLFSDTNSPWQEMLKVDILNCMGLGIALLAVMAICTTADRVRYCAIVGCVIALLAPVVTQLGPSIPVPLLRDYFVPSLAYFSFFPWAAFIAFGMSFGSLLRMVSEEQISRGMQWVALAGIALAFGISAISVFQPALYPQSDFWLDGPALIFIKLGVLLLMVSFSYVWLLQPSAQQWSWVRQLGTTSLLVYWVHIELVYGHWLGWMKLNLDVSQTMVLAAAITAAMVGLSWMRTSWPQWKPALEGMFFRPTPQRVAGD